MLAIIVTLARLQPARLAVRLGIAAAFLAGSPASAQSHVTVLPLTAGSCEVTVRLTAETDPAADIEVFIDGDFAARRRVNNAQAKTPPELTIRLLGPLLQGDMVTAREVGSTLVGPFSGEEEVGPGKPVPSCAPASTFVDTREPFRASFYTGMAFDSFAPAEVGNYRDDDGNLIRYANPAAGGMSKSSFIAGTDFSFRVAGDPESRRQFWLTGQTVHGVRSADVNCTDESRPQICESLSPDAPSEKFLYALAHATSLEATLGGRFEFKPRQKSPNFASVFYLTGRAGVQLLDDGISDAWDAYHLGGGWLAVKGPFEGSYLESGWGRTDLFFTPSRRWKWHRVKFDGFLSMPLPVPVLQRLAFWEKMPRVFLQLYADFDPVGDDADSVQIFVGFDTDLTRLFE